MTSLCGRCALSRYWPAARQRGGRDARQSGRRLRRRAGRGQPEGDGSGVRMRGGPGFDSLRPPPSGGGYGKRRAAASAPVGCWPWPGIARGAVPGVSCYAESAVAVRGGLAPRPPPASPLPQAMRSLGPCAAPGCVSRRGGVGAASGGRCRQPHWWRPTAEVRAGRAARGGCLAGVQPGLACRMG